MINNKSKPRGKSLPPNILKEYKITHELIAEWFNYSSANSFSGSRKGKEDILNGIQEVINYIKDYEK